MTRTISTGELRRHLAEAIDQARQDKDRIIVARNGIPVAALISMDDPETFEALEDESDARAADEAKTEGGARPLEEVVTELKT